MATARKASKPTPVRPLYLRIAMLDTDGEERRQGIGPYFAPTAENLEALMLMVEIMERRREGCLDPIPVVEIVHHNEPLVIDELDQPFTKSDAMMLVEQATA